MKTRFNELEQMLMGDVVMMKRIKEIVLEELDSPEVRAKIRQYISDTAQEVFDNMDIGPLTEIPETAMRTYLEKKFAPIAKE